ncbi:polyphosphate:AMP phosphotransferase [Thermodesulfobium narugense DSM 14796]|uniref:Polyphosphate:AMP phosphotransferase n=1 Tax=Thermodesulfobium narugense DSM 14796 TaxID=747365 RepID=M1E6U6_9BACT|nr:polyphosphate:AMP phosphotransferase [Thermodesulfobium narugense]AEE13739.1 polyphosphate:AMP phosphotransferase [Thermodesulfobium narugense DSM 14796]
MLEKVDLNKIMDREDYKKEFDNLSIELGALQREARDLKLPIIIVFDGFEAAGKGTLINKLMLPLDPRGYDVIKRFECPSETDNRPYFYKFWKTIPKRGDISIVNESWYKALLSDRVLKKTSPEIVEYLFDEILSFEGQLVADGYLIVKFFLYISEEEQKDRLKKLKKNKDESWRVTDDVLKLHKKYKKFLDAAETVFEKTDTAFAPWTIIEATDKRYATIKIFKTLIEAIKFKIKAIKEKEELPSFENFYPVNELSSLSKIDLNKSLTYEEYIEKLHPLQREIHDLQYRLWKERVPVIVAFEGWDAAGKGGSIKRLTEAMDPRGYTVIPIGAPNEYELAHHYLWRFWQNVPEKGNIAIFDRTWYGRVLVERVEKLCKDFDWQRAYGEIKQMEKQFTNFGIVLLKFWLHIDKKTQLERFEEREKNPFKHWKITEDDWRNRSKWDDYLPAVEEMLIRTSTAEAPWNIIEANDKYFARIKVLETFVNKIKEKLN